MPLPDPKTPNPLVLPDGRRDPATVFLAAVIDHPRLSVGVYTYGHNSRRPENWAATLAPYLFPNSPERLRIGRFCQIAEGVQFITDSANHPMDGLSTYPFAVFDPARIANYLGVAATRGDTVIGNDCWFGRDAMVLPGAQIGDGVIIGARAVVSGRIPSYAVVVGAPARVTRMRFSPDECAALDACAWWDWARADIEAAQTIIEAGDPLALKAFAQARGIRLRDGDRRAADGA